MDATTHTRPRRDSGRLEGRRNRYQLRNATARELEGLSHPIGAASPVEAGYSGRTNRRRAELYRLAEFYVWSARRFRDMPLGGHPLNGRPWSEQDHTNRSLGAELEHAQLLAAARVCYARARAIPNPLP